MKKLALCGMIAAFLGMTGAVAVAHDYDDGWGGKHMGRAMAEGRHWMTGKVESVDHKTGWVKVKTDEGSLTVHFPPDSLKDVKEGDTLTVHLAFTKGTPPKPAPMMEEKKPMGEKKTDGGMMK